MFHGWDTGVVMQPITNQAESVYYAEYQNSPGKEAYEVIEVVNSIPDKPADLIEKDQQKRSLPDKPADLIEKDQQKRSLPDKPTDLIANDQQQSSLLDKPTDLIEKDQQQHSPAPSSQTVDSNYPKSARQKVKTSNESRKKLAKPTKAKENRRKVKQSQKLTGQASSESIQKKIKRSTDETVNEEREDELPIVNTINQSNNKLLQRIRNTEQDGKPRKQEQKKQKNFVL